MTRLALLVILLGATSVEADKKCVLPAPIVVAPQSIKAPPCHRATKPIEAAITKAIKKDFHPERGGKPEITFPCDGLGSGIREIVVETGNGHGGTLGMWRAKRRSDGKYDVRGIVYRGQSMTYAPKPIPHVQARGIVALPELAKARSAMSAKVREVTPPPKPGEAFGMSSSFSSHDFHIVLRMVDDDGRVDERRFTGTSRRRNRTRFSGS